MPEAIALKKITAQGSTAPIPRHPALMKCALVDAAFDKKGWIFEPKFDGLRVICIFDGDDWMLLSRNDKPQNFQFPEIVAGLKRSIAKPAVVDGEVVCLDENGKSSFRLLQQRFHLTVESLVRSRMARFPTDLYLFDILYFDQFDLRKLALNDRKRILKQAVKWKTPIRMTPMTLDRGIEMFHEACDRGEEGIIAKRADSRYTGDRGGAWLKIKCSGRQEFVIGGFTKGQGTRVGFGSILVGYYDDDGKLRFVGKVGTGFDTKTLLDLHKRMKEIQIDYNPFANKGGREYQPQFVEPKLVCEIAFAEWTQNHMLRQPRFQGLREDKKATDVKREDAAHLIGASNKEGSATHERNMAKVNVKTSVRGNGHSRLTSASSVEPRSVTRRHPPP
jgi:DNA ligase D-like protein (predicted ligase)